MSFDRPTPFHYNADLQTLSKAINQLIDAVEALQSPPEPVKRAQSTKTTKKS